VPPRYQGNSGIVGLQELNSNVTRQNAKRRRLAVAWFR